MNCKKKFVITNIYVMQDFIIIEFFGSGCYAYEKQETFVE